MHRKFLAGMFGKPDSIWRPQTNTPLGSHARKIIYSPKGQRHDFNFFSYYINSFINLLPKAVLSISESD